MSPRERGVACGRAERRRCWCFAARGRATGTVTTITWWASAPTSQQAIVFVAAAIGMVASITCRYEFTTAGPARARRFESRARVASVHGVSTLERDDPAPLRRAPKSDQKRQARA